MRARDADGVRGAYARWSERYDADENPTRDAALSALEKLLPPLADRDVLEIGCGTGESTLRLRGARSVAAVDFSEEMLSRARAKLPGVSFVVHDVREPLPFGDASFDLVTENLVLEHIDALGPVLAELHRVLRQGGAAFLFELHPYRQLAGKQARFEGEQGTVLVPAFVHSVSEFVASALGAGFVLAHVGEWVDGGEPAPRRAEVVPRVLSLGLSKPRS